ncbi:hypothetical protein ACFSR7_36055 [Cohnella sp. GCM10020058]|uniref:hypothetical protein n=1 Tax=Cohnella sp. GCM10020058 TaxID=3317330 RepID=UPI003630AA5D
MTFFEIEAAIRAYEARLKAEMQKEAMIAYRHADLIAALVARVLGNKNKAPTIQEAFPGIFPEVKQKQQDWRLMQERLDEYRQAKRRWRERGGKHDAGGTADSHNGGDVGPEEGPS